MPEPRETVAEALKTHRYHQFYECCCCVVDPLVGAARARRMTRDEHLEHVADAVLAAFTQEWGASDAEEPDDPGAWMADRDWAERYAKSEGGKVFTRFVTPWVGVQT